jgi:hypothetical protein
MKEDIFSQLHYSSGLVAQGCWDELDEYDRAAIRRFGDMIVAQCIATVQARFQGDLNREDLEVRACVEALKNKFGVEL